MKLAICVTALAGGLVVLPVCGGYRAEVSPTAAMWEVTAARELTNYLDRVVLDGQITVEGEGDVVFHVGDTDFAKEKGLASSKFRNEEWGIRSFGRDVVLNGGGTRGCLYAVYHFLEDFCDIRWWYDDDEDVPPAKALKFPQLKKRGKPHFFYRDIYRDRSTSPVFAMRCRLNGNGNSYIPPEYGGGEIYGPPDHAHTFELLLPWAKHGKEHPEWFSLVGGRRIGGMGRGQLCLTNPELKAVFLELMERQIAKGEAQARAKGLPPPRLYAIAPNDNRCYCECEACQAEIKRYGHSGYHLRFSNFVAGELGKRHPELIFSFEAYHESAAVPKGGVRALDNVIVRICNTRQNVASGIFAPENALMHDQVADWSKYAKILSIWEYAVTYQAKTKGFPYPSEFYIPERYRYYAEKGAVSVLIEHEFPDKSDFYDLKFFLERHALEDPFCDGEKLMAEFRDRYFGPAGEKMMAARRYLDEIRRARNGVISWSPNFSEFGFLHLEDAERMTALFDEAEALVKDDPKRLKRVRRARAGTDRYTAAIREASKMHPPEAGVSDVPFYDFLVRRDTWYLYNRNDPDLKFVDEPLSATKLAVEVPGNNPRHYYDFPFVLGIEDVIKDDAAYRGEIRAAKPGSGYDWYDFKDVRIPSGGYYLFLTRSWAVRIPAMPPIFCGKRFTVRVHMNFEGPLYGRPGDVSRIRIDRLVFIPCDDPVLGNWGVALHYKEMNAAHFIITRDASGTPHASVLYRASSPTDERCEIDGNRFRIFHRHGFVLSGEVNGDRMTGTVDVVTEGEWFTKAQDNGPFTGWRNPPIPAGVTTEGVRFGDPVDILADGLDGFVRMEDVGEFGWSFKNGVLSNRVRKNEKGEWVGHGVNIRTKRADFYDFRLDYDVRVPKDSNSGVYLRGRYEIQTIDSFGKPLDCHNMAALYGRITPSIAAEKPAGEWQHVSVLLYRRHITVVLNGKTIIDNKPVEGVTGGAVDANEFAAGPLYIQGDHSDADYRNMILRPVLQVSGR